MKSKPTMTMMMACGKIDQTSTMFPTCLCFAIRSVCESRIQCDQMDRLFFNIGPFIMMIISPTAQKIAKVGYKLCPN